MRFYRITASDWRMSLVGAGFFCGVILAAGPTLGITLLQVDDFQDGTKQNWQGAAADVLADAGPAGIGDFALEVRTSGFPGGTNSRLITYSGGSSSPVTTQWTGNWTAAGVSRLALDARNSNPFDLVLWLGIAGPIGPGFAGGLDSFVTNESAVVPPDDQWHTVHFSVLPEDFSVWTSAGTAATALADVFQLRIIHSPERGWVGEIGAATMLLDNIRAVPEPTSCVLLLATTALASSRFRLRSVALHGEERRPSYAFFRIFPLRGYFHREERYSDA